MQKSLLIKLSIILWVIIFYSCTTSSANLNDAEQTITIIDMSELSINQMEITAKENHVLISHPEYGDEKETRPHVIGRFKDGLLMIDMYKVENSDTADINVSYFVIAEDLAFLAGLAGSVGSTFSTAIRLLNLYFPDVRVLGLSTIIGGVDMYSMAEAMERIREYGYGTWASADSEVLSAGVDIFMAGKFRYAEPGARMGVHDFIHLDRSDYMDNNPVVTLMENMYQKMGISPEFFDFMRSIPSDNIHFLSAEELEKYQIVNSSSMEEFQALLGVE